MDSLPNRPDGQLHTSTRLKRLYKTNVCIIPGGKDRKCNPVANLEPVLLSGTTVKRPSLHNADQIALLDLHLNDMVYVEKGGEIIPKIVGVDHPSGMKTAVKIEFITCPECGTHWLKMKEKQIISVRIIFIVLHRSKAG